MGCASSTTPIQITSSYPMEVLSEEMNSPSEEKTSFHRKFALGEKISQGKFSQFHKGTVKNGSIESVGREVGVKIYSYCNPDSQNDPNTDKLKLTYHEVRMWNMLHDCENILHMQEAFFDTHLCYVVTEKCDISLLGYLDSMPAITEASLWKVFSQMLRAISHVHAANLIHGDIRPENFWVGGIERHTVKLCDFGLTGKLPESGFAQGAVGETAYMSPEMVTLRCFNQKSDVWSFGVVAYLLLSGKFPCAIEKGRIVRVRFDYPWLSSSATCFLKMLLCNNFEKRSTAKVVLNLALMNHGSKNQERPCIRSKISSAAKLLTKKAPRAQSSIDMLLARMVESKQGINAVGSIASSSTDAPPSEVSLASESTRASCDSHYLATPPTSPRHLKSL